MAERYPVANLADEIFKAASGRLDRDGAAALAGGLDPDRFVDDDGKFDSDKVARFVDALTMASGRRRPGAGREAARAEAKRRFGTPSTPDGEPPTTARDRGAAEAAKRFGRTGGDAA